jgi:hypothetical protein
MRKLVLGLAVVLCASAQAASSNDRYQVGNAGNLASLCATPTSVADHAMAIAFCHGVLAGAYGYFEASTPAAERFVCVPDPSPTRSQVANEFVAWMKTRPNLNSDHAIDALFRFAAERFPCKR